jgi:hypothetical protein
MGPSFTPDQGGGVDVSYSIENYNLSTPSNIALYWSKGATFKDILSAPDAPVYQTRSQTGVGSYDLHVDAGDLGTPPKGTTGLLLVVNAPVAGSLQPIPNDVVFLGADPSSILSPVINSTGQVINSVNAVPNGAEMDAYFRPAGGALTLAQAAAICGVEGFNWYQTVAPATPITQWRPEVLNHVLINTGNAFSAPNPFYNPSIASGPRNPKMLLFLPYAPLVAFNPRNGTFELLDQVGDPIGEANAVGDPSPVLDPHYKEIVSAL